MKFIKIIILALIFVLFIALVIQNQQVFTQAFSLKLNLNFYQIGPYLVTNLVLIAVSFLIGVIFAVLYGALSAVSMRRELREKDRRIKELERQRTEVRTSPTPTTSPYPTPAPATSPSPFKSPQEEKKEDVKKEESKGLLGR